jgi:hypothetical protein
MHAYVFDFVTTQCLLLSFFLFLYTSLLIDITNTYTHALFIDLCHLYFTIDHLSSVPASICSTPFNSLLTTHHNTTTEAAIQSTYVSALDSLESDDYWLTTSSFTKV